ncbi:MAG: FAD-dependent oxidoreductase [Desulfobacterales bacterium]
MAAREEVLIIGGGVAGLSAALGLSQLGIRSVLVEKRAGLGGYAAQYACKATAACVKCGACVVMEKISRATVDPNIEVLTGSRVERMSRAQGFETLIGGTAGDGQPVSQTRTAAAVILACGFKPFDPENKPYGYKRFANVVTNLDLEKMLRAHSVPLRPSDGAAPARMAFVQCVGSRDASLGHLWCSKVCCASALRMARLIKMRRPATEMTFFYIDIQTFGEQFQGVYEEIRQDFRMIRALPGDVFQARDDSLTVVYYDSQGRQSLEEPFDMLVLSVGITPAEDTGDLAAMTGLPIGPAGFVPAAANGQPQAAAGVFAAGTVCGPMSIAESVAAGDHAAQAAAVYLRGARDA